MFSYITVGYLRKLAKQLFILAGLALFSSTLVQGGVMSVPARLAPSSLLLDVARTDGRLVAVGERGHILLSTDEGTTWEQKIVPTQALLTSVFFLNDQQGWAVGHDQTILATTDGGQSWQLQHEDNSEDLPLFDIWFADAQHGLAVGAYALWLVTEDGGQHWDPAIFEPKETDEDIESIGDDKGDDREELPPFDYHLHRFALSDTGTLYLVAEAGYVFRSQDQGKTWVSLPSPYEGSFFGVTTLQDEQLLLYGLRGHLFRSEDGGENWIEIETGTLELLSSGARLSDGTILVAGSGGAVLVSQDGGQSFTLWRQKDSMALAAIIEAAPGEVIASGAGGIKTLDVGSFLSGS